jgi:hypothetical protein
MFEFFRSLLDSVPRAEDYIGRNAPIERKPPEHISG